MLGVLYSVTTISGPPLAILFNNQGLVKTEFRAGLALVRVAESTLTAIVYYRLGLFAGSTSVLSVLAPSVVVGIPLGAYLIRSLNAETFRRICMSFDAWVVGFGLSRVLIELSLLDSPWAYSVMVITILIDLYLLYVFFAGGRAASRSQPPNPVPSLADGQTEPQDHNVAVEMRAFRGNVPSPLETFFGYVIAVMGIAVLIYTALGKF